MKTLIALFLAAFLSSSADAQRASISVLPVRYLGPIFCDLNGVKSPPLTLDLSQASSDYLVKLMPHHPGAIDLTPSLVAALDAAAVRVKPASRLALRTTVAAIACSPSTESTAIALPLSFYTYFSESVTNVISVDSQLIDSATGEILDAFVTKTTSKLDYSRHTFPFYFLHYEASTTPNLGELVREAMRATAAEVARTLSAQHARSGGR